MSDAADILQRFFERGIRLQLGTDDAGQKTIESKTGMLEPADEDAIREHAAALAAEIPIWKPGARRDDEPRALPEPEPEPDPVVEISWFPTEQRIPLGGNRVRHIITSTRRLELADVLAYLDEAGDREAFDKGQISKREAFEAAGRWYRHRKALADAIAITLHGGAE